MAAQYGNCPRCEANFTNLTVFKEMGIRSRVSFKCKCCGFQSKTFSSELDLKNNYWKEAIK